MAKTETHIPKLRFSGFADPWQKKELGKISTRVTRKNTELESELPLTISAQYGLIDQRTYFDRQIASRDISGYFLIKKGEFAYNKSYSNGYPLGAIKRLDRYDSGVLSTLYIVFKVDEQIIKSDYISAYYDTNYWHKEVSMYAAEGARNHGLLNIAPADFFKTRLNFPKNTVEQTQIGDFFQKIDQVIELQQKALETAQDYKKSMLQKMFPQKGKKVPKVRFDGFIGDWEIFKFLDTIEDVIDFRGRTPLKIGLDWSDDNNGYLALSALNVKQGYIDFDVDAHYGNDELYQKWMSGKELRKGQVLFTTEAPMGNVAQVPDNRGYILSQRTIAFITKKLIITDDFLACLLRSHQVVKELQSLASGGTATGVSQRSLSRLKIQIPKNIEEQRKIGAFFQKLDQQIAQHEKKLESYQSLKKAMLQRMFV